MSPAIIFSYTNISDNNVYPNHMHSLRVIVSNIILRIIFKPHAYLQIMVRTSVQFENCGRSCAHKVPNVHSLSLYKCLEND